MVSEIMLLFSVVCKFKVNILQWSSKFSLLSGFGFAVVAINLIDDLMDLAFDESFLFEDIQIFHFSLKSCSVRVILLMAL